VTESVAEHVELVLNPQARLSWERGRIHLRTPQLTSSIRSNHPWLLNVLQFFARPHSATDARRQLSNLVPGNLDSAIDLLVHHGVLVPSRPVHDAGPAAGSRSALRRLAREARETQDADLRVLFVVPVDLMQYGSCPCPHPTGLFLSNIVRQRGHQFRFTAEENGSHDPLGGLQQQADILLARIAEACEEGRLPVVGISCFTSMLYQSTMLLAAVLRAKHPELVILVGGHHPAVSPESLTSCVGSEIPWIEGADSPTIEGSRFLQRAAKATQVIRERDDHVFDFVFAGRADSSFPEVLDDLVKDYRRPPGPVVKAESRLTSEEMRSFRYSPEVFDEIDLRGRGVESVGICFSLGCPQRCLFCVQSEQKDPWRAVSPEHAVETLRLLYHRHGIRHVAIGDANFACSASWRQRFLSLMSKEDWAHSLGLDCEMSVMHLDVNEPVGLDCVDLRVQVGVESASPEMLRRMGKAQDPRVYLAKVKRLVQEVSPHTTSMVLMLILGFPGETKESLTETFRFLFEECRINDYANVRVGAQVYLPLAGSGSVALAESFSEDFGFVSSRVDWWAEDFRRRHVGLRPSSGLAGAYCGAIADRICEENRHFSSQWCSTPAIRRGSRERLADWLTHPLLGIQTCRVASRMCAEEILEALANGHPRGTDGRIRVSPEEFESGALERSGEHLLELIPPHYAGRGDFPGNSESEILSLVVGEVLGGPVDVSGDSGYWLVQRVE